MLTLQDWLEAIEIMSLKTDEKGKAKTNWNKYKWKPDKRCQGNERIKRETNRSNYSFLI